MLIYNLTTSHVNDVTRRNTKQPVQNVFLQKQIFFQCFVPHLQQMRHGLKFEIKRSMKPPAIQISTLSTRGQSLASTPPPIMHGEVVVWGPPPPHWWTALAEEPFPSVGGETADCPLLTRSVRPVRRGRSVTRHLKPSLAIKVTSSPSGAQTNRATYSYMHILNT